MKMNEKDRLAIKTAIECLRSVIGDTDDDTGLVRFADLKPGTLFKFLGHVIVKLCPESIAAGETANAISFDESGSEKVTMWSLEPDTLVALIQADDGGRTTQIK